MGSNSPKNLLIRADANTQFGTGHLMRCLALAQTWQDAGGTVQFVLARTTQDLKSHLTTESMDIVTLLDVSPGSARDAEATISVALQTGVSWAVVDGYHFGAEYQRSLKMAGLRVLLIDDYGHAKHYFADVVLNQNIGIDESLYLQREPYTHLLLGNQYVLLRREFWPWRGWRREISPEARKVLVTLGGSDPHNITLKVIKALQQVGIEDLEVIVVVGGSNPHLQELESVTRHISLATKIVHNVKNMPELMARADVAISAGGSTCWELAFIGVPTLILILANNQTLVAVGMDGAGAALNLGWHTSLNLNDIARSLREILLSFEKRRALALHGQQLVDGNGAKRVIRFLRGNMLTLRPVRADDCRLIWEWANDHVTRAQSFSTEPISWEEHSAWFEAKQTDPLSRFYIAEDENAAPIGQVRYQIEGETAVISVSLAPNQRGLGYSTEIIRLGTQELWTTTTVNLIYAYIKPDNCVSISAFTKAGFVNAGTTEVQGYPALHFVLRRAQNHEGRN
jgi:UDP-2,4-diacetamido-2,4,6-trideoxy-beta-L-altropyranose hydrolase